MDTRCASGLVREILRRASSIFLSACVLLCGFVPPTFTFPQSRGIKNVFWQPNDLQQGSVAFVTDEFATIPLHVTGQMIGKNFSFFKTDNPRLWYTLAGVDLDTTRNL